MGMRVGINFVSKAFPYASLWRAMISNSMLQALMQRQFGYAINYQSTAASVPEALRGFTICGRRLLEGYLFELLGK
jgi:hypothetical protein